LCPISHLADRDPTEHNLLVVAQSRRDQFSRDVWSRMLQQFVNRPVVALLGSWCEGESRSGQAVPGVVRVYWHQWIGQLDRFLHQLQKHQLSSWHLPRIAANADRILLDSYYDQELAGHCLVAGISSLTESGYSMIADGLQQLGCQPVWLEAEWGGVEPNCRQTTSRSLHFIVVNANSLNGPVPEKVKLLRQRYPRLPIVLMINFPRRQDLAVAARLGVDEIVSKPFQLHDLQFVIARSVLPAA
jgi:hypothetical protein